MKTRKPRARARRRERCCAARRSRSAGCCSRPGATASPILPEIVQIESTNICNAKCVFCPRDEMHRAPGRDEPSSSSGRSSTSAPTLGITHVRVHNYGEPFLDRQLVEKVRYAKEQGITEVGMISNGSLITEEVARGMIEAGLDAINISVDAAGKEVFERDAHRPQLRQGDRATSSASSGIRAELGRRRPKLILSFVRQNNSADEQAFIEHWRDVADKIHITDLHNWAGTLNHESDVNYPCYRPVADLHGAVGRPGLALLRRFRRQDDPRRPQHARRSRTSGMPSPTAPCAREHLESGGPGRLPRVRSAAERLAALDYQAGLTPGRRLLAETS